METIRSRIVKVLNNQMPQDRLPLVEWAPWWSETVERWEKEGLPENMGQEKITAYWNLDSFPLISIMPDLPPEHTNVPYEEIKDKIFTRQALDRALNEAKAVAESQKKGEVAVRLWLDGFFWFPRRYFGIEAHLFAFYDQPELMHQINADLADYYLQGLQELFCILKPDVIDFAEDMSYNLGPMLSEKLFDTFLLPYYQKVIPFIKQNGIRVMVDTDGLVTDMVPWLIRAGVDGVFPLERQAGVDLVQIKKDYPAFVLMGGYDKMVMWKGEAAIRAEFERILPAMKQGGYLPSVDHQTPPSVSMQDYKIYRTLLEEYCVKAVWER